jgi:hypothetical membrane protein
MDITPYHWYFAIFFIIAFTIMLLWAYKNDLKKIKESYGKTSSIVWIIVGILLFILMVKFVSRNI